MKGDLAPTLPSLATHLRRHATPRPAHRLSRSGALEDPHPLLAS
jgi:hypothetical protein